MNEGLDFYKNDRRKLFEIAIENIEGISNIQQYTGNNLEFIGALFTDKDFIVTDVENNHIYIYENNKEILKIDRNSNVLVMLKNILND